MVHVLVAEWKNVHCSHPQPIGTHRSHVLHAQDWTVRLWRVELVSTPLSLLSVVPLQNIMVLCSLAFATQRLSVRSAAALGCSLLARCRLLDRCCRSQIRRGRLVGGACSMLSATECARVGVQCGVRRDRECDSLCRISCSRQAAVSSCSPFRTTKNNHRSPSPLSPFNFANSALKWASLKACGSERSGFVPARTHPRQSRLPTVPRAFSSSRLSEYSPDECRSGKPR